MDLAQVRTVVLAGGRSQRMGFDKLTAPFDGVALARRVVLGLRALRPLVVATPAVAATIADVGGVLLIVTEPTAGPSETLALAHAALPHDAWLAVMPCDLPFLDAARVAAFAAQVPDDADLAWPVVGGTPGLRPEEQPMRVRDDGALRAVALEQRDDAYVTDVDTPEAWATAQARAATASGQRVAEG
jgi:CTP:molybdopterin cytidylyltransferase MocA